jgi:hypothetical protein
MRCAVLVRLTSGLTSLRSAFAEAMPHNSTTIAEAGYDIRLSDIPERDTNEVMVWVDTVHRETGGAARLGRATIDGQRFTVPQYGEPGGENMYSSTGVPRGAGAQGR